MGREAGGRIYLREKGYVITAANYRTRFGEIDLIAEKGNLLAFVEVKLRKNDDFAQAREFVDSHKQKKLKTTAELWLSENPTQQQIRFDVIEVYTPDGAGNSAIINHIENAF